MRTVIQRVQKASVKTEEKKIAEIGKGLLILLGIEEGDQQEDINWSTRKISNLRIFNNVDGVMNLSLKQVKGEALVVSQFTLHASTKKGHRPSYIKSARPEIAEPMYEKFIEALENELGKKIETGKFGADMKVELVNDGPVTILIDSKQKE